MGPTWMQTYPSGTYINLLDPDPDHIVVEDMCHHLSMLCRFNGGTRTFYSVAEHSVLVGDLLRSQGYSEDIVLAGYLHDGTEAFASDVITPAKATMRRIEAELRGEIAGEGLDGAYQEMSEGLDDALASRFNLPLCLLHRPEIKLMDRWALRIEAAHLTKHQGQGWQFPELPNEGSLPGSVVWAGGLYPSQARDELLNRLDAWKFPA